MIKIIDGNLFDSNANIICHQCNCQGVMGSGVAAEVKRRYPHVFQAYRKDYLDGKLKLGYVCFATAKPDQVIANMCGQNVFGYDGNRYTDYDGLKKCLDEVYEYASFSYDVKPTIAFPWNMACCRGGGDWNVVRRMIEDIFSSFDVEIWRLDNG
jgi:O-acetyl-ADP-ribose deacetylase (regulator of RNase III)